MTIDIKHPEPMTVYIDNNVWDFLFERNLVLCDALPPSEFRLCITREVELEVVPIKNNDKKQFIQNTIQKCNVETRRSFGFCRYDEVLPDDEQRIGGFGLGYWVSQKEGAFIVQQNERMDMSKKRPTKLYKNEADIVLASRSLIPNTVILTFNEEVIFRDAIKDGGKIINLKDFKNSQISLKDYVLGKLAEMASGHKKLLDTDCVSC